MRYLLILALLLTLVGWGRRAQPRDLMFLGVCTAGLEQRVYLADKDPDAAATFEFEALLFPMVMPTGGCLRVNDASWKVYGAVCMKPGAVPGGFFGRPTIPTALASPRASIVAPSGFPACSVIFSLTGQVVGPLP